MLSHFTPAKPGHRIALLVRCTGGASGVPDAKLKFAVVYPLDDQAKASIGFFHGCALRPPREYWKHFVAEEMPVVDVLLQQSLVEVD